MSSRGQLAFVWRRHDRACANEPAELHMVLRDDRPKALYRPPGRCGAIASPDWSPDGRQLVLEDITFPGTGAPDEPLPPAVLRRRGLGILDALTGRYRPLHLAGGYAAWSPDGRQIAYRGACGTTTDPMAGPDFICLTTPARGAPRVLGATSRVGGYQSLAWVPR
jgi:hypothetical protein